MENPSYEDDDVSIVPARFSAISASNVLVLGREKSKDKLRKAYEIGARTPQPLRQKPIKDGNLCNTNCSLC